MDAAGKSDLILARLKQRYPEINDESHLASLANVWAMEVNQIINKMFDITFSASTDALDRASVRGRKTGRDHNRRDSHQLRPQPSVSPVDLVSQSQPLR